MALEQGGTPHNPFEDYIAHFLDLHGITSADSGAITERVRMLFDTWMQAQDAINPSDYLDEFQEAIRSSLTQALISSPLIRRSDLSQIDPNALAWLVRLSITLAFAFQTELDDFAPIHQPHPDDDYSDARRLRRALVLTSLYARRAAWDGDPMAHRINDEAEIVLEETERLK